MRQVLAAPSGPVGPLSAGATTGCRPRPPRAFVPRLPERVTCLPCRERTRDRHRRPADRLDRPAGAPGPTGGGGRAQRAAARRRDPVRHFAAPERVHCLPCRDP
ncbi:hypothetical protein [Streptomyces sp. NPDC001135]